MQIVETQGALHATHEVEHADLANIDAIACAGGDGTMSEIVQVSYFPANSVVPGSIVYSNCYKML